MSSPLRYEDDFINNLNYMYCNNCGSMQPENSKFCHNCGKEIKQNGESKDNNNEIKTKYTNHSDHKDNTDNNTEYKSTIKCGNCGYIGKGESGRNLISIILAWVCILFCWPITVIYYLATSKYKCPKCRSTFLGIKNKQGVFTQQKKWGVLGIVLIVLIVIAVIGLISTLAVVSLNEARIKSRDAKRVSDIKQIQTALALYYNDFEEYPISLSQLQNYLYEIPTNPIPSDGNCEPNFEYTYQIIGSGASYRLDYCLGEQTGDIKAGRNTANPVSMVSY